MTVLPQISVPYWNGLDSTDKIDVPSVFRSDLIGSDSPNMDMAYVYFTRERFTHFNFKHHWYPNGIKENNPSELWMATRSREDYPSWLNDILEPTYNLRDHPEHLEKIFEYQDERGFSITHNAWDLIRNKRCQEQYDVFNSESNGQKRGVSVLNSFNANEINMTYGGGDFRYITVKEQSTTFADYELEAFYYNEILPHYTYSYSLLCPPEDFANTYTDDEYLKTLPSFLTYTGNPHMSF